MAPIDNTINRSSLRPTLAAAALDIAISQLGQCEQPQGSNSGPMVDEYLRAAGLGPGYAWCQAFVYWCYKTAAEQLQILNPLIKTAGVRDCWNRSVHLKRLSKPDAVKNPDSIRPGDQFVLFMAGGTGHTGIVERVRKDDKGEWLLHTIEGNSNDDGSREGYAVVRHKRKLADKALQGFIRYSD